MVLCGITHKVHRALFIYARCNQRQSRRRSARARPVPAEYSAGHFRVPARDCVTFDGGCRFMLWGENAILCYCNILKDTLRLFACPSTSAGKVALKRRLKINWTAKWKCYYFSYFSARKPNAFLSHNKKTDSNNFLANLMFAFLATKRTTVIICVDFPSQHCISVRLLWNYTQHALFPFNKVPWKLRQYAFFLSCLRYLCIKLGQCFQWQTNNL